MNRICKKCGEEKPISEFGKHTKYSDGINRKCKSCHALYLKEWRKNNPERHRQIAVKSYQENKEKILKYQREYYLADPEPKKERMREYSKKLRQLKKQSNDQ